MADGQDIKTSGADEEAAAWVVRMASDQRTRGDEDRFREWLSASLDNAEAYAEHELIWTAFEDLGDDEEARAILLPRAGLAEPLEDQAQVVPLRRPAVSRRAAIGGGLAFAASVAAVAIVPGMLGSRMQTYETMPGEQRTLALADGSEVVLNTDSRLRVEMVESERRLFLDRGQVFFRVARDATRPFRVFVGDDEVRALGTAFDVRRIGNSVHVILEEGKVAIFRDLTDEQRKTASAQEAGTPRILAAPEPETILRPGERAELVPATPVARQQVDVRKTQAWRFGRMILDETPLGAAIDDLNRYGGREVVLSDPQIRGLRVSGVYHTNSPTAFVDGVVGALPVVIENETDKVIVLGPAR